MMKQSSSEPIQVMDHPKHVEAYLKQIPPDVLIGITAPLKTRDHVIISIYNEIDGSIIVHVDKSLALQTCRILYEPKYNKIAVHGIKTVWQDLQISDPVFKLDYLICTKLIAYLMHPEWDEHQYFLGYLA